jgi:DNA repair exonuclease SbcCD ATPase subunit
MTGEADVFYKTLHKMVGDKKLEKSLKTMPDFMASFIKNYDPSLKVLNKDIKTYAKAFGGGSDKATKKAIKAYSDLGNKLYKNSDEYKENSKQLKKNAKAIDKIREKTKKYQKIVNDPKASAKRKQSAKKRIEELDKEYAEIKKKNKKIGKEMALGPGKAVKALVKDVKKAVKEYVSLSNIDFTKVLSGFDKKIESTNLQRGGFDIFNSAVISMEDATKAASDAFGILNVSVSDSINLLERFSKVSTVSARRLMKNAQSQIKGYEEYRTKLAQLKERGLSDVMIKQLESQGVSSLSQIRGFLKMSDADISKYNALVEKEEAYKAKETENSMKNQVDKYTKWVENLEKLSGKIPQKMLKELRSAGVSNADFVETLLYMDDSTLSNVTKMYTDSLKASVDAAYKTVADAKKAVSNKKIRAIAEIISEVGSKFDLKKSNARLHSEETTLDESEFQSIYRKIVSLLN